MNNLLFFLSLQESCCILYLGAKHILRFSELHMLIWNLPNAYIILSFILLQETYCNALQSI